MAPIAKFFVKHICTIFILFAGLMLLGGCDSQGTANNLYQVSTLQALMDGMYDGQVSIGELKQQGTQGIGTVNGLDGELVVLDDGAWHIRADGKAYPLKNSDTTPFADVTDFFISNTLPDIPAGTNFEKFKTIIDSAAANQNLPLAIRVDGTFSYVKTRSVPAQKKPYPPLTEVVKHQPVFELRNVSGTLVGFRMPGYFNGVNMPGYHLHFITADRTAGGHVLDFTATSVNARTNYCTNVRISLPTSEDFAKANLSRDMSAEIRKVEK